MYRLTKRAFDVVSAATGLLIALPLWLIIIVGIKVSSRGPVFYTSERIGQGRKPFKFYKFRSMHVYQPGEDGLKTEKGYIANADRIFPFGRFLRKSKLDELPQLINVLKGEMSVVGPRPVPISSANRNYVGRYRCILDVKPGLTCLDSLFDYAHGELFVSNNEEYAEKIVPVRNELARMYVGRKSVFLDMYCIVRTVKLIIQIVVKKKKEFPYTWHEKQAEKAVFGS